MGTRSILFDGSMVGHGIVNYDSNEQRFAWNKFSKMGYENFDNVQFGKKRWYLNEDGTYNWKTIISGDCLRHYNFIDDFMFQSPNVYLNDILFNRMIATPASILRGYTFASKGIKKKSAFSITEAQQSNNAVSTIEFFSRSGHKERKEDEDSTSDTTIFKKECVGDIEYKFSGVLDIRELQFISMSELYDRLSMNPDHFETLYKPQLEKYFGSSLKAPGYYTIKGSSVPTPEYGLLLTPKQTQFLARELFKRLLRLQITKSSNGWAKVSAIRVKYVEDVLRDSFTSKDNWKPLTSENEISFTQEEFYEEHDPKASKKLLDELENALKEQKKAASAKNKAEKAERAEKKAAKGK